MWIPKTLLLAVCVIANSSSLTAQTPHEGAATNVDSLFQAFEQVVSVTPSIPSDHAILLMVEVADTRELRALPLLIRALAFNMNPLVSNEKRSTEEMIPAMKLIKTRFGEEALPVLYESGIEAAQAWYQERIAYAVKYIASEEKVQGMNSSFAEKLGKQPSGKRFAAILAQPEIKIEFYYPGKEDYDSLDARLKYWNDRQKNK